MRSSFSLLLLLGMLGAGAASATDVRNSKEHPLLPERFAGATIVKYETKAFDEYVLPTGPVANIGKVGANERLEGKITRIVYEIPKGVSTLQVFRNYEELFRRQEFSSLFECDGAACGDRNARYIKELVAERAAAPGFLFASDVRYVAAKRSSAQGDAYASLLLSQDASGSTERKGTIYALLEIIEVKPLATTMIKVDAAAMEKNLTQTGRVALYGIYFDFDKSDVKAESDETLQEIAKLLGKDGKLKLFVVGHTDGKGSAEYNQSLSQRRAEAVVRMLVSRFDVAAGRLKGIGVGMYAPVAPNTSEEGRAKNRRVELVPQEAE
jgi:outer membrane protein OmpA-like peptidoglycan-associated protein